VIKTGKPIANHANRDETAIIRGQSRWEDHGIGALGHPAGTVYAAPHPRSQLLPRASPAFLKSIIDKVRSVTHRPSHIPSTCSTRRECSPGRSAAGPRPVPAGTG